MEFMNFIRTQEEKEKGDTDRNFHVKQEWLIKLGQIRASSISAHTTLRAEKRKKRTKREGEVSS